MANMLIINEGIDGSKVWERILGILRRNEITDHKNWCIKNDLNYRTFKNAQYNNAVPVLSMLVKYSQALNTTIDYLVTGSEKETTETDKYSVNALRVANMFMKADKETQDKVISFLEVSESYQKKKSAVQVG